MHIFQRDAERLCGIEGQNVWRNDGHKEEHVFLGQESGYRFLCLAIDDILVECLFDGALSTSFQMRHVVDIDGNRGFMFLIDKVHLPVSLEMYRQGTTQDVYDEVLAAGKAVQQESLRLTWIRLNS